MNNNNNMLIRSAPSFDVHRWSDYPEVNDVVEVIFKEVIDFRKSKNIRIRGKEVLKRAIKTLIIDLWAAKITSMNPYRFISKNKSDYQKETRYHRIYQKYDYLISSLNDLVELGYVDEILGYKFENQTRRTRIKGTDKLFGLFDKSNDLTELSNKIGRINLFDRASQIDELIQLKDEEGNLIEYQDNDFTHRMRSNLVMINQKIAKTRITLDIDDEQYEGLIARYREESGQDRFNIDFNAITLYRVFNNSSWEQGGRFYGGWWENLPKEYRKYIEINYKHTVEVDYSGHHLRMLYAKRGIDAPDDPYDLWGVERDVHKQIILIILNSSSKLTAVRAIRQKLQLNNVYEYLERIEFHHSAISKYFYTGIGKHLMNEDSMMAEEVMLRMLNLGATVLPVHDSFIVRSSYQDELQQVMNEVFTDRYKQEGKLKAKQTVLEEERETRLRKNNYQEYDKEYTQDICEIIDKLYIRRSWKNSMWGM